jgi:anti-sigma regulatory factor (Ser/Thr protein kinase)
LRIIRAFVETVARQIGFDDEGVAQIEMAVDEACSNVWIHAYPSTRQASGHEEEAGELSNGHPNAEVVIHLNVDNRAIAISIIDSGIGNLRGPHEGIASMREYCDREGDFHGLGTFIIRSFMDEVEYHYPQDKGTVVRMKKYLKSIITAQD